MALALSKRAAARLLGIDHSGEAMAYLVREKRLRMVPFGRRYRIPLEDVQRVAREGFELAGRRQRVRASRRRSGLVDPEALRRLDVEALTPGGRP
jgi:hypothetical protein